MTKKVMLVISLIGILLFSPLVSGSSVNLWQHWNDADSTTVSIATESEAKDAVGIDNFEGYSPSATFYCWSPYIIDGNTLQKGFFRSNIKPKYCVWEYYDPHMHKFYKVEKKPAIIYEGDYDGYKYIFADHNEFIIPALFLSERYGTWLVRTYFIFEDGSTGGEGPAVDGTGNSYMIQFPVVHGSKFDLIFTAPIYFMGHKTIPIFFWLTPIWAFLIFIVIVAIYTRSIVGGITIIKDAINATREAKAKWRSGRR
ncbi:MAG: hypothetical protein J7L32_04365 [Thermoplasmata archaeon]|nr:hypothetical protein [Thermoplasmata archaeon]